MNAHGLSAEEFKVLCDLIPHISREPLSRPSVCVDESSYRLLYEASEARYIRMKTLVRTSLEKQSRMEIQLQNAQLSGLLNELDVQFIGPPAAVLWATANELRRVKDDNQRLKEINRTLRVGIPIELPQPEPRLACSRQLEAELYATRQQIAALDLELLRMSDQRFEDEERIREYEDVLRQLTVGDSGDEELPALHPRFHPMAVCKDPGCRSYVRRLRNGLRQSVAESYVRERFTRIHGHYRHVVQPLEHLRLEKDQEIEQLRLRLKRLECATFQMATEEKLNDEMAMKAAEVERAGIEIDCLQSECAVLRQQKAELVAEVSGLQAEAEEARDAIDEGKEQRTLCRAEMHRLEKEREAVQRIWDRIESFRNGKLARDYDEKRLAYERLEREMEILEERVHEMMQAPEDEDMESDEPMVTAVAPPVTKRPKCSMFVACLCGKTVRSEDISSHIVNSHLDEAGQPAIPCPMGCGYYVGSRKASQMASHLKTHSEGVK